MSRLHGSLGKLTFTATSGTAYDLHVFGFDSERTADETDGSELGNVNAQTDVGLKRSSGTFMCYADDGTPFPDVGAIGTLVMGYDQTPTRKDTVKIVITSRRVSVGMGGNIVGTFGWKIKGDGSSSDFAAA